MKRLLMTIALTFVLSCSALAGEIPCDAPAPPPPAPNQITSEDLPGEIPTSGYVEQISDAALSGLLTVLSLVAV